MQPPDLSGSTLAFEPESFFYAGDFDPAALIAPLKAAPGLNDFNDEHGNRQSAVRLDTGEGGYWITVPAGTPKNVLDTAVAAYKPPAPATPPIDPAKSNLVAVLH